MTEFTVKARLGVQVEMTIKAETEEQAVKIFKDHIAVTASLPDVPGDDYDVLDDAIWEMDDVEVDEA